MSSAIASLFKNLILISILLVSVGNFFYSWVSFKELFFIQFLAGLAYVFLSCYEVITAKIKSELPVKSFSYITNKFITFKVVKIGIFLSFGIMLYLTKSRVQYLYPVCFIIAVTEVVVLILRYVKKYGFVSIYANYLFFCEEKITKLFASQIKLVEYRHEIFYFIKTNNKTIQINLSYITNKKELVEILIDWINRNKVKCSDEAIENLKKSIQFISN